MSNSTSTVKKKQAIALSRKPLGETLMEAGLISASQIEIALREQKIQGMRIGEIFALHNWVEQVTADFFVEKWTSLLEAERKRPLVYYFKEAGLLNSEQINELLKLQQRKENKVRFHRLAVEQGYLRQLTVDFFLSHLFNIYNPHNCSFTDVYGLLRKYNEGETSFINVELKQAPLVGVSLKEVGLDGSNLRKANLRGSNLSHSSLVQVNLAGANLTQAVLTDSNLERACLNHANLQEAHLDRANFKNASLQNANLKRAYLFQASFIDTDLRGAELDSSYPYDIYYSMDTLLPDGFDPQKAGWKLANR